MCVSDHSAVLTVYLCFYPALIAFSCFCIRIFTSVAVPTLFLCLCIYANCEFCSLAVQTVCTVYLSYHNYLDCVYYYLCSCPDYGFSLPVLFDQVCFFLFNFPAVCFASIAHYSLCFCKSFYSYLDGFSSSLAALTVMCFSRLLS
jgi:hypothetical protein